MMTRVADYVIEFLDRQGVTAVFTLPGGFCMHLVDALGRHPRVKPIGVLHEQAAAIAADGYAQATGRLGAAIVTLGPGATNAITGVAGSWADSVPVLIISGQGKRSDVIAGRGVRQMAPQEVLIIPMVRTITKFAATVLDPQQIRATLEAAVYHARLGRPGPAWVEIPLDVQGAPVDTEQLPPFTPPLAAADPGATDRLERQVLQTIERCNRAERPVILVGNGARIGGAFNDLRQLVGLVGAPVLTTWMAADFIGDDHPLAFGRPGSFAPRFANFVQQNTDFLLSIGARLSLSQVGFNYRGFAPRAAKVVVDVDAAELKKLDMPDTLAVRADAGEFTAALLQHRDRLAARDRQAWIARCRAWRDAYPVVREEFRQPSPYVSTYVFVEVLSDLLTPEDVVVPGSSGGCAEITFLTLKVKPGQRVINSAGLGAMGFGLPSAFGACLGSGRRTITIIGDGGLQHNIQTLMSVSHHRLPLKMFIISNNGYASIRDSQRKHFSGRTVCCDPASGLSFPILEKIAEACRLPYESITGHDDLPGCLRRILEAEGPVLCELLTDPAQPTIPRLSSQVLPDGRVVSRPLEDLFPFLDREELKKNMLIGPTEA